jgi:thiol-disulfide isomerase/thioredoxin
VPRCAPNGPRSLWLLCAAPCLAALFGWLALLPAPARGSGAAQLSSGAKPQAVKPVKDPEVVDLEGYQKLIASEHGSALLVTFWATWCEPCRDEYPLINELARQYAPQGLVVLGLSYDDDAEINVVRHFLARNQPVFPNFRKKMGHVDEFDRGVDPRWPGQLPVNFFYSADGRLLYRLDGAQPRSAYETAIRGVLATRAR